jgi:hypothetical protein
MADIFINNIQVKKVEFMGVGVCLSKKQLENCRLELFSKKHWTEKIEHLVRKFNQYIHGSGIRLTSETLPLFIEQYLPAEEKRHQREFMAKSKVGLINSKFTPTDIAGTFDKEEAPKIGKKYHLSWASKGAVFVLKSIDGEYGYVDNPKNKRLNLMKIKLSELRKLR